MSTTEASESEINPEQDDLPTVAAKLGVKDYQGKDCIIPTEKQLQTINEKLDNDGNSILIRFAKLGKSDVVEFLLKFDGILINHENKEDETAAEVAWDEKQFVCLLKLLEADALFPLRFHTAEVEIEELKDFLTKREKLHADIKAGDLQSVKDSLRNPKPSIYLNTKNRSALFRAAKYEKIEIYAYLLSIGAKFKDSEEENRCSFSDYLSDKLNDLLEDQFLKIENYHVMKLLYRSKSPQTLTGLRYDILKSIYEYLRNFKVINLLMKVLEYEDIDVVFDFEKEHTNNIYFMSNCAIDGLTVTSVKRIFIGAKKCLSTDTVCKEVAGTLAHELCHMAMEVLYRNNCKPYLAGEESVSIGQLYKNVLDEMYEEFKNKKENIDEIIQSVFLWYPRTHWESELIVRVPHILGSYGEEEGEIILRTQAKILYDFYVNHVVTDSEGYTNPAFVKKALCSIEYLHIYHGCISKADMERNPFKIPLKSYRSSLVQKGVLQVITTNVVKLCAIHIYHEMKMSQRYQINKTCLFFRLDCFLKHNKDILKAFECSACRLMVLVCNEKLVDLDFVEDFFFDMDIETGKKEVILVVGKECEILSKKSTPGRKPLNYSWKDLSEDYKKECSRRTISFKGHETSLNEWIKMENISKIISSADMLRLTTLTTEVIMMIGDGRKDDCEGYNSYYYVERDLEKVILDEGFFLKLPETTVLYITGLSKEKASSLSLDESKVQWLKGPQQDFDDSKHIFIREVKGKTPFGDEFNVLKGVSKHWLHYSEGKFHILTQRGIDHDIGSYERRIVYSERQVIGSLKNRIVLISDDPGTGKSTLLSSLIRKINECNPECWVARIDLIEYSLGEKNPLSLEKIKLKSRPEEILEVFFKMCGLRSDFEVYLMKQITKSKELGSKCKVFLDGYDEVSSLYRENLLTLFRTLIKETSIQLWITTRVHERIDLEVELGTCSFSLIQFSNDGMTTFLEKLWKHRLLISENINTESDFWDAKERLREKIDSILKENQYNSDPLFVGLKKVISELEDDSEELSWEEKMQKLKDLIEGLDFKPSANDVIIRSSIKDKDIKFTGIPLHLYMVGSVVYDNNLRLGISSDLYGLYTEFVRGKIEIYWLEKEKITTITPGNKRRFEKEKINIFKLHMKVARVVLRGGKSSKRKKEVDNDDDDDNEDDADDELGVSVGILTKLGENFNFIHRTFAEYFFAESILQKMKEDILIEVMFDERYNLVRTFLSSGLDREDRILDLEESSFEKLKMESFFKSFAKKPMIRDSNAVKLFRKIIHAFEDLCKPETIDDFILKFAKFLSQKTYPDYIRTFRFLRECLTDKMLSDLFGKHIELTFRPVSIIIRVCNEDELREILGELENSFRGKPSDKTEQDSCSEGDEDNLLRNSVDRSGEELLLKFVRYRDSSGYGILHLASMNYNTNVFTIVLELLQRVLDEKEVIECILETTEDGSNIMHCSAMKGALNVQEIISSIERKLPVIYLLIALDGSGRNVLHIAAANLQVSSLCWLFDFLYCIDHGVTLRKLLVQGDQNGKTIIHYMCEACTGTNVEKILKKMMDYMGEDAMKKLMWRRDNRGNNMFHFLATLASLDIVPIFKNYFDSEDLTELLLQVNDIGRTCLHWTLENNFLDTQSLKDTLRELSQILSLESFMKLLLIRDDRGQTFLQELRDGGGMFVNYEEITESLRMDLPESSFQELINALPT